MRRKFIILILFIGLFCVTYLDLRAQPVEPTTKFIISAELVSNFVWRGSMATASPVPSFQPTLALTKGNFEFGVWGSTDFTGSYKEVDPYASISLGQVTIAFTDYNWNLDHSGYFNFKNNETGHRFEGTLGFTGKESFPISINWNTMFYGFDKDPRDTTKQAYSTYIELSYSSGPASCFIGFTPWTSFYNNYGVTSFEPGARKKNFSIVNIGASVTKELKINETFSIPVKCTLVVNPSASYSRSDYIHLVFGLTF